MQKKRVKIWKHESQWNKRKETLMKESAQESANMQGRFGVLCCEKNVSVFFIRVWTLLTQGVVWICKGESVMVSLLATKTITIDGEPDLASLVYLHCVNCWPWPSCLPSLFSSFWDLAKSRTMSAGISPMAVAAICLITLCRVWIEPQSGILSQDDGRSGN